MVKPIGHLSVNLKSQDKVSHRLRAKYGAKSEVGPAGGPRPATPPAQTPRQKPKYKSRKR